jgi:hypothetical protein
LPKKSAKLIFCLSTSLLTGLGESILVKIEIAIIKGERRIITEIYSISFNVRFKKRLDRDLEKPFENKSQAGFI